MDSTTPNVEKSDSKKSEVKILKPFSLEILKNTKTSQLQHGLRHNDYQRYRQYCTRRVRRLRKSLKFLHGKSRFAKKVIEPSIVNDERFLHLVLVNAERSWSYAMQMKDDAASEPRIRFHMHRRLAKAAFWAKRLELICTEKADQKTILEAEAYSSWMGGNLLLEKEIWEEALAFFMKARTIYDQLGKIGDLDEQELFRQKLDEIDPSIRFCNYNLKGSNSSSINNEKLMEMKLGTKGPGMEFLQSKLDAVIAESVKKQAESMKEITWQGRKIPIKSEKIRRSILSTQESIFEVDKTSDQSYDAKMSSYDKLLLSINDAMKTIQEESSTAAIGKINQNTNEDMHIGLLKRYMNHIKLSKTIDRDLLMLQSYQKRLISSSISFPSNNTTTDDTGMMGGYKKKTKPEDIVRVYETLISNLTELNDLKIDQDENGNSNSNSIDMEKENTSKILSFKAMRCFYKAMSYSNLAKWNEALALYQRADEEMNVALEHYSKCKNVALDTINKLHEASLKIKGNKSEAHANGFLMNLNIKKMQDENNNNQKEEKNQENSSENGNGSHRNLLTGLTEFDTSYAKNKQVIPFPPNFEPISCKPVLFDLALLDCNFPNLEARKQASKQSSSSSSSFWGWFGGSKQ